MNVTLYSTECPKCRVLTNKLSSSGIRYKVNDDRSEMECHRIKQVPVLKVGDKFYDFYSANEWVNRFLGDENNIGVKNGD